MESPSSPTSNLQTLEFLSGGGEMGELTRHYDWSANTVGPISSWPQSLKTTVSIILNSRFPMFLWWGEELIQFYNDAYRPSLGNDGKHPHALGQHGEACWQEIWPAIKPLIDRVFTGEYAHWSEDQLLPIYRNGKLEDVYWTFSYSPVKDERGKVGGVLVTCFETTEKITNLNKIAENEQQLRFAVDAADLATWDYNPVTNKFSGNDRIKEWFGLQPQAEIDLSLATAVMIEEDRERVILAIQKALDYSSGGDYDIEYTIINPLTNQKRIVRAKGKAWFHEEKIAYRFNGTLQDVTEQVNARKKIEDSEQRFRSMVQQAPVAIGLTRGRDMIFESVNAPMYELLGKTEDIKGKYLTDVLPELEGQAILKIIREVYDTNIPYRGYAVPAHLKNGDKTELRYFNVAYSLLHEPGLEAAILHIATDVTEQVLARKKIEEADTRFRSLITSAPIAIALFVGRDLIIETPNQEFIHMLGKGPDIAGKRLVDVMPELIGQPFLQILDDVYTSGKPFHTYGTRVDVVYNGVMKEGYYDFSYTPLFDSENNVYAILEIAEDVTDSILVKNKLQESEQNLRNTILQAPVAMCIFKGASHVVEIANARMFELWGKKAAEVLNKPIFEGLPEAKGQGLEVLLDSVYSTGKTIKAFGVAVNLPRVEGIETIYIDFVYEAFKGTDGNTSGVMAVAIDVTEQVLARQKIEEAEVSMRNTAERLQLALDAGKLGSYELTIATGLIDCTPQCKLNFGTPEDGSLDYLEFVSLIVPEDRAYAKQTLQKAIAEHSVYNAEYRIQRRDGIRWIKASGRPVYNEKDEVIKVVGITLDITEHKTFAEELSRQVHERTLELQRSNEDLLQFAHVASHDLKEPARKVKTFTNRLKDEFGTIIPEKGITYLEKTQHATDRMYAMIEGVLNYSTLSSSEQTIQKIDLNDTIKNIELDLEVLIQHKKGIIIKDTLPVIEGASVLIYQLFYNLINNSFKFSKKDIPPTIIIRSSIVQHEGKDLAKITIADNGIGFDKEYTQHIFNAFARLNSKDKYEGTGLGLALCKKIAERHHGSIQAESIKDQGATFILLLPLQQTTLTT